MTKTAKRSDSNFTWDGTNRGQEQLGRNAKTRARRQTQTAKQTGKVFYFCHTSGTQKKHPLQMSWRQHPSGKVIRGLYQSRSQRKQFPTDPSWWIKDVETQTMSNPFNFCNSIILSCGRCRFASVQTHIWLNQRSIACNRYISCTLHWAPERVAATKSVKPETFGWGQTWG